jgi:long-chain acyl-CoA synthetase
MSVPGRAASLSSLLIRTARCWPRLPALAVGDRVVCDYAEFASRVAALAAALRAAGLAEGARVALLSRNVPEYIEALFACWWAGLIAVPVNAKLHPAELAFILADSGAEFAFVDAAWRATLGGAAGRGTPLRRVVELGSTEYMRMTIAPPSQPAACGGDDPAWLFYTSGTTGRPKGVEITHRNLLAMSQCFLSDVESIEAGDAIVHAAPLSHGSGLYVVPHVQGAAVHVLPEAESFDAAETLRLAAHWNRSCLFAAPTMVKRIVTAQTAAPVPLARLKSIVYGGGPMYVADCKEAFTALGPRLAQIYGQGESPMTITAMNRAVVRDAVERGNDARVGSVGVAQTGIDVMVAGADDEPLREGEVGEILVRGPTVMRGYWRNAEASAAALAHGWLHTGDVGRFDDDGFLTLIDRSKDLIISGGSNIYPREVEEVLLSHPEVAEVAIVGRVHAEWGEEVVACVVIRGGVPDNATRLALERSLDALCLDRIARFKRPKTYAFLAELPKNNAGKVLKTALRERVAAG